MTSVMKTCFEARQAYDFGFGRVDAMVTSLGDVVDHWIESVLEGHREGQNIVVGLECKFWGDMSEDRIATLVLCVDSMCFVIQLAYLDDVPVSLVDFLSRLDVVCVGKDVKENKKKLRSEYGIIPGRTKNIWKLAARFYPDKFRVVGCRDLKTLAKGMVDLHMPEPKFVGRKDWRKPYLDDEEIEYACLEAYASCMVGMEFLA